MTKPIRICANRRPIHELGLLSQSQLQSWHRYQRCSRSHERPMYLCFWLIAVWWIATTSRASVFRSRISRHLYTPLFWKKLRSFAYQRVWSLFSQDNRDVSRMLLSYLSLFLSPFVIPFPSLFVLTCFTFRFKGNLLRDNDDIPCNLT